MEKIIDNPQQFQNVMDCIKATSHFAGTQYKNICDGTTYFVANGFWDYIAYFGLLLLGITMIGVLASIIKAVFN